MKMNFRCLFFGARSHSVVQAGLADPPALVSGVLGLQTFVTIPS